MSDRDMAIGRGAAIEQMLTQIGATGLGLGQKSLSLQHLFTDDINRKFKFICFVRNKAAHEVIFEFDRMDRFVHDCDEIQAALNDLIALDPDLVIVENRSQSQTKSSHDHDFSIPPDLVKFKELTFSSITGRVIQTTRNQSIWLRLANGQEQYLQLTHCVVEPMRKGHLVTIVSAKNGNENRCLAIHISELEQYFSCTLNIKSIRFKWYSMLIGIFSYFAWLPTCGFILFASGYYPTRFLLGDFVSVTICSLCSFIIIPFWLVSSWAENRDSQLKNHVDRIFGHSYVKHKGLISPKMMLVKMAEFIQLIYLIRS